MRSIKAAVSRQIEKAFPKSPFQAIILTLILATPLVAVAQSSKQPKPVARLVSSSRQTAPARPRLVASIPVSSIPDYGRTESARRATSAPVSYSGGGTSSAGASSLERRAFDLVNSERRSRGESSLVWDAELSRLARQHSLDMARSGFLGHGGSDGRGMADRARTMGIRGWRVLGENVAFNQGYNDPSGFAVQRWMGSSKHRANILNGQFTRTGIGVARGADGSIYFTQVFMN